MILDKLKAKDGVQLHAGMPTVALSGFEIAHGVAFPDQYKQVLLNSNGIEIFFGYDRLFGVESSASIDAISWNESSTWKFAWPKEINNYWCFGETAWGDQFAFDIPELKRSGRSAVYFLDGLLMQPRPLWKSFDDFFDKFQEWASTGGESQTIAAKNHFGPIEENTNLVYSPPLQLGGEEDINNVSKMNARSAMIINGDIQTQLSAANRDPIRTEMYEDDRGNMRLRLIF